MPGTKYKLASEDTMRTQLWYYYYQTKACMLPNWDEFYVELAGAEAAAEEIFNHILITAFRRLVRDTGLEQKINGIDLRPTLKLVSAILEKPAEGPAVWKELYEAGFIDQETFEGPMAYDDDGDMVRIFLDEFAASVPQSAAIKVDPPMPAKGMKLGTYVHALIKKCEEEPACPPEFEVNPNMIWGKAKRLPHNHLCSED